MQSNFINNSRKVSLLIFLFFISSIGCLKIKEHCPQYFDIRKMNVYGGDEYNYDDEIYVERNNYTNYTLVLNFEDSIYFYSLNTYGGWNNILLADDCEQGKNGSKEFIAGFYIFSSVDFDSLHLAGDTLNDIFGVNEFLNSVGFKAQKSIELKFSKPPDNDKLHTLTVHYYQTNGEHYADSTKVQFYQ